MELNEVRELFRKFIMKKCLNFINDIIKEDFESAYKDIEAEFNLDSSLYVILVIIPDYELELFHILIGDDENLHYLYYSYTFPELDNLEGYCIEQNHIKADVKLDGLQDIYHDKLHDIYEKYYYSCEQYAKYAPENFGLTPEEYLKKCYEQIVSKL